MSEEPVQYGVTLGIGNVIVGWGCLPPSEEYPATKMIQFKLGVNKAEPGSEVPADIEYVTDDSINLCFISDEAIDRLIENLQDLKTMTPETKA